MIMAFAVLLCFVACLCAYSMAATGKIADQRLRMITENSFREKDRTGLEGKMESQRDVIREIENEIKKGSAPLHFAEMGFAKDAYHLVESQAKLNQLLDYFFRNGEYAELADRQIKSNIYMDASRKSPMFRSTKSELDRRNMGKAAKRWIKKRQPAFDGDVYVEDARCYFSMPENEMEKRMCMVEGEPTAAMIFSKKHLAALYLQCLINRKEAMQRAGYLEGFSDVSNRIYRLEDVDVLFQCLLMDDMQWEDGRAYVQFATVYLLKKENAS